MEIIYCLSMPERCVINRGAIDYARTFIYTVITATNALTSRNKSSMQKPAVYLNQRIRKDTVRKLRQFEKKYRKGKKQSITETIELLLLGFDYLIGKAHREVQIWVDNQRSGNKQKEKHV